MLGIRKERIDPGEPWQNYAETLFSIQRRLGDHAFSNARTWPEIQQAHQTLVAELQRGAPLRPPRTPGRTTQPGFRAAWSVWAHLPRRGALAGAVCDPVYPPSRQAWLHQV